MRSPGCRTRLTDYFSQLAARRSRQIDASVAGLAWVPPAMTLSQLLPLVALRN